MKNILTELKIEYMVQSGKPFVIDSGKSGRNVAIIACTHGNEKVGIAILRKVIETIQLTSGKVTLILGNPKAYRKFRGQKDSSKFRYIKDDPNRINLPHQTGKGPEFRRKKVLDALLDGVTDIIDVHSMHVGDTPIIIADPASLPLAIQTRGSIEHIILQSQDAGSLTASYARRGITAVGIEVSQHNNIAEGIKVGMEFIGNYLGNLGMTRTERPSSQGNLSIYEFEQEIKPVTNNFRFLRELKEFDAIKPGEVFAMDGSYPVRNEKPYDLIFAIPPHIPSIRERKSAGFLLRKKSHHFHQIATTNI